MGIKIKHPILLPEKELQQLKQIIHKGVANKRTITRARILRMAHDGKTDKEIYTVLNVAGTTPYDIRKRYHEGGLPRAVYDLPRSGQPRKLSVQQEAKVVAIACTKAP